MAISDHTRRLYGEAVKKELRRELQKDRSNYYKLDLLADRLIKSGHIEVVGGLCVLKRSEEAENIFDECRARLALVEEYLDEFVDAYIVEKTRTVEDVVNKRDFEYAVVTALEEETDKLKDDLRNDEGVAEAEAEDIADAVFELMKEKFGV